MYLPVCMINSPTVFTSCKTEPGRCSPHPSPLTYYKEREKGWVKMAANETHSYVLLVAILRISEFRTVHSLGKGSRPRLSVICFCLYITNLYVCTDKTIPHRGNRS